MLGGWLTSRLRHSKATLSRGPDQCAKHLITGNFGNNHHVIGLDKYGLELQPWNLFVSNDNLKNCLRGSAASYWVEKMCTDDTQGHIVEVNYPLCYIISSQLKNILVAFPLIHLYILWHSALGTQCFEKKKNVCENCSALNSAACQFCAVFQGLYTW